MKMSYQLILLGFILQGVVAPDPFNQFMRQHYNQPGQHTPGTSGSSYPQYSASGNILTSGLGTQGYISGTSSNTASNQQLISPQNTQTFGFETQRQITGFETAPNPGPKLMSLQAAAPTINLMTGVSLPQWVQVRPLSGPKLLPLQATAPINIQINEVGTKGKTSRIQPSQTFDLPPLSPVIPLGLKQTSSGLNQSPSASHTFNQLSGPPQLPVGAAQPQTMNQPRILTQPQNSLLMAPNQPQNRHPGQSVQTNSGAANPLPDRLPVQNPNVAGKLYPGSMTQTFSTSAASQPLKTGTQPLPKYKAQTLSVGGRPPSKYLPFRAAQPTRTSPQVTKGRPSLLPNSLLQMIQVPQAISLQSPQALQSGSKFFLPPLQQATNQQPLGAAKPSHHSTGLSQQMNTIGQTLPGFSSPPVTYNPSRLEQWAIKSYNDDSVAKFRTLERKSYLQLIAKRQRALANQQLSQALMMPQTATKPGSGLDLVMPDYIMLDAARDLDCETIPEVRGLDVRKYHPMGCDDDQCPPGKECRTLGGVGMCCPSSVSSKAIRSKSRKGQFEYLGFF